MKNLKSFIESGILESYVMGSSSPKENDLVEEMAAAFTEVREEIDSINEALESYAFANAVAPGPVVKPFVLATIDFTQRMKKGEQPSFPPELCEGSNVEEFADWLNRPDMILPATFTDFYARIIGYTPVLITAIAWIKDRAPKEVHENEYEKFLVVEGTCNIDVDGETNFLGPGDYFAIPLYKTHQVIVTSSIPCKVILQRAAA